MFPKTVRTALHRGAWLMSALAGTLYTAPLQAQTAPGGDLAAPPSMAPALHLSGPRVGMTFFTGDIADLRTQADMSPFMSQFGWQFEKRLVATSTGIQALLEWIPLLGGIEDENTTFSNSFLTGIRTPSGLEIGVGPNISFNNDDVTTSIILAAGVTLPFGEIQVPINFATAFAEGGPRITALIGWMIR